MMSVKKQTTMISEDLSSKCADNIRLLSAAMVEKAQSGHPGGPMGGADFMHILYSEFLNFDHTDPTWCGRDRFYLDAGHMSAMLYSTLSLFGYYLMDDLRNFRQWGSSTPGHPEVDIKRGIENTSGPLGLGHAFGIGAAIAERFLVTRFGNTVAHKTYIYISDGGVQEEISQGAGRIAGHLGLGNIIMFYDANDIQLSTEVEEVTGEDTAKKYESWNWHVLTIDGNNHQQIREAIKEGIANTDQPTLIIGKTIMGKGVVDDDGNKYEGKVELHGKPLGKSKASYEKTVQQLGGDLNMPFQIFEEVGEYYKQVKELKQTQALTKKKKYENWRDANPSLSEKLDLFLSGNLPELDWSSIEQKNNIATRDASGAVMAWLHGKVENLIISSADLSNSDKTNFFLNKTTAFSKNNFEGAFLQAGVSELTMAALCTGMALHGGVIPICATFFAFSDYMKPVLRMAALMEQQVIFIWTHDAFRVGEDGPTHQPIEQEAQLRLLEKLQNHSHKNSMLVLRPADANETTITWKMALENMESPTGLILSRQKINDIPSNKRFEGAKSAERGGYIVKSCDGSPDVILIANGSEVSTLLEGAAILEEEKGIKAKVVSIPSEGVFLNQDEQYQKSVLPNDIPIFGLTAGLSVNLQGLVGNNGTVWGLNHFGYSAPYTVLDEKFGFTPTNVVKQVISLLS